MKTFDQALFELYETGLISYEDALRNADSKNELRLRIKLESKRETKNPEDGGRAADLRGRRRAGFLKLLVNDRFPPARSPDPRGVSRIAVNPSLEAAGKTSMFSTLRETPLRSGLLTVELSFTSSSAIMCFSQSWMVSRCQRRSRRR